MKFLKLENNDELQANLFSFAIHLALFLVMIFSVGWQTKTPYYGEVELWDSVPVQKKINKTQATLRKKLNKNKILKPRNLLKQKQRQRLKRKQILN